MQQAIPYKTWLPIYTNNKQPLINIPSPLSQQKNAIQKGTTTDMGEMVSDNAVIVFARRGCCMSHVMKRLLLGLGVNPAIYEIDNEVDQVNVVKGLEEIIKERIGDMDGNEMKMDIQFPAVFIGGKLFGGLDRLMSTHISGELVPMLKEAGALWL